jgi:tetratricopeptide (TPR) repeat protein
VSVAEGTSKLWPVLTALVLMPAVAIGLEQFALRQGTGERVIHVDAAHSTDGDDVDVAATVAIGPEHEAARARLKQGDAAGAVALFAPLAQAHPESAAIAFEYGAVLLARRDVDGALVQLLRAKTLADSDPRVAVLLARALSKKKDAAGAEAELRRALTLRPGYGSALRALGKVYSGGGRTLEAIEVLTQASQFGSNEERATSLVALGAVLLEAGRNDDARTAFQQAIERAPAQVEIRLGVARAWLATDKKEDATRASGILAIAADLAPDLPDVQTLVGQGREATGDLDGAEDAYWQAIRLAPQSLYPRRRLLRLALERQRFVKARQQADELLAIDADEPEHHFLAGLVASRQNDNATARTHYQTAIDKSHGDYPEAWFNLGLVEKDEKNLDGAIAAYQTAIDKRPGYHAAENNLGLTLVAAGRAADAEKLYRDVLSRSPSYAPAWVNLGKLYSQQKKYPEAIDAYQKALEARPDYARALLDLGVAYARSGRVDDAIATYQKVIALNPRSVSASFNLALVFAQKGDKAAAEATWVAALAIDPDHVPSQRKLAMSLAARGADAEARALFEDLLDAEPKDVEARLGLAALHKKAGNLAACAREASLARTHMAAAATEQRTAADALERSCQP